MNLFHKSPRQETINVQVASGSARRSLSSLKKLVADDPKMYSALENFLIVDPERQLPLLDDASTLLAKGNTAKASGNNQTARVDYEVAAKIEIYKQNKESARSFLVLAEEVTDEAEAHYSFQKTMLADMDKVLRISKDFQALTSH